MASGKKTEISVEKNLELSFLFISKNVASGYALCHFENGFFLLHVCFKIVTQKWVISPLNWNIKKDTSLNAEGVKCGTKRINMKIT